MVDNAKVAIVNQRFARHFFGNKSAIGRHVGRGGEPDTKLDIEIVGVSADTLYEGPREGVRRQVFIPNWGNGGAAIYVRAGLGSNAAYAALRSEVKKLDQAMPVYAMSVATASSPPLSTVL